MSMRGIVRVAGVLIALICSSAMVTVAEAQNQILGEVRFTGTTSIERDSGVWVDGQYLGYLKELKGKKKVLLLPGKHEIAVRQSGYDDFSDEIVVEPGQIQMVEVTMKETPRATVPGVTATLKLK